MYNIRCSIPVWAQSKKLFARLKKIPPLHSSLLKSTKTQAKKWCSATLNHSWKISLPYHPICRWHLPNFPLSFRRGGAVLIRLPEARHKKRSVPRMDRRKIRNRTKRVSLGLCRHAMLLFFPHSGCDRRYCSAARRRHSLLQGVLSLLSKATL